MPAATPPKVDFKKSLDSYKARRGVFQALVLPPRHYLMIDGSGDPNTSAEYTSAVQALYPLAYALKFHSKRVLGRDYVVPPLEGLWWADDMGAFTTARDKSQWHWTLMLYLPDWLGAEAVEAARAATLRKKPGLRCGEVRWELLAEGPCLQTLHIGPFDEEAAVLAELHDVVIPERGLRMTGLHHEIYLSDFRRVEPEKRRTILRQPVEAVDGG